MKESIFKNITQVLMIVFSVVLGLYLSERIEDRKNKKEATKLMSKIKSELKTNKKLLDEWVPYHQQVLKALDSLVTDKKFIEDFIEEKASLYRVFTKQSLMGESPTSDAWDIAKSHPLIVNFDYDELFALSRVYNQQKSAFDPVPRLVEFVLSDKLNAPESAGDNLMEFKNRLSEIFQRELKLISYYNDAERILKYQGK